MSAEPSSCVENRPSMLEKGMYDSWKTRICLYIKRKENGEMLINSIEKGPFQLKKEITVPSIDGAPDQIREQTVEDLSPKEKLRYDCDIKAVNILLIELSVDIYTLINHYQTAKEIWDRVKELMENTELTLQELANTYNPPPSYSSQRSQYTPLPTEYYLSQPYQPNTPLPQQQIIHSLLQQSYEPPVVPQQSHAPLTQLDSGFVIPYFLPTDDLIASLNKAMLFLSSAISSRFPPTNNQLKTSSNLRTQATIQDGRVTVQNVQGRQSQGYAVNTRKTSEIVAKQCTTKKRVKDSEWFKEKMLLAHAQEAVVVLHEDQQDFLADRLEEMEDCDDLQLHTTSNINAYHVDAYDSDCDDEANANILSEVPHYDTYHETDVLNSDVQETKYSEHFVSYNDSYDELTSDNNVISYADYTVTTENDVA
ncbi:hypothetical protein Tco_0887523 [Tanacetum coccineum]